MKQTINELVLQCNETAKAKGFWDSSKNVPEKLCLIHAEVSEALEELRKPDINWENFTVELADVCIRIFDLSGHLGLDLGSAIERKMNKNKDRPYLHGKQF
jgi:NTP pyrophosphatase (non-canonical NTP hydrolase)